MHHKTYTTFCVKNVVHSLNWTLYWLPSCWYSFASVAIGHTAHLPHLKCPVCWLIFIAGDIQSDLINLPLKLWILLKAWGYPFKILTVARNRAQKINCQCTQSDTDKNRRRAPGFTCSFQYSPLAYKIIYKNWYMVEDLPGCSAKPKIGFKRSYNCYNLPVECCN